LWVPIDDIEGRGRGGEGFLFEEVALKVIERSRKRRRGRIAGSAILPGNIKTRFRYRVRGRRKGKSPRSKGEKANASAANVTGSIPGRRKERRRRRGEEGDENRVKGRGL